jgi:hypothetical protein
MWEVPGIGVPNHPFIDGFSMIFLPSSYWGTPMTMETPMYPECP